MKIDSLRKYNGKNPSGFFNDLPPQAQMRAWQLLGKFEARWHGNLPRWQRAILIGQAKRLARMSDEERSLRSVDAGETGWPCVAAKVCC